MEGHGSCVSIPLDHHLVDTLNRTARQLAILGGWELCGSANTMRMARQAIIPQMATAISPLRYLVRSGELLPGTATASSVSDIIAQWTAAALAYAWLADPDALENAAADMRSAHPDLGIALGGGCPTVTQLNTFVRRMTSRMIGHTRSVLNRLEHRTVEPDDHTLPLALATCGLANLSAIGHLGYDSLQLVQRWGKSVIVNSSTGPQPSVNTARFSPRWPSAN
jgi:hypothetical protein